MKIKEEIWVFLCVVEIILLHCIRVSNVFDVIYYTGIHEDYLTGASIRNIRKLGGVDRGMDETFRAKGYFYGSYREEYLEDRESCSIYISRKKKILEIEYEYREDEIFEVYRYTYDVKRKTLTHQSFRYETSPASPRMLQKENVAERKQYFYDGFLKDWFTANQFTNRFSPNHLGIYRYEEKAFKVEKLFHSE